VTSSELVTIELTADERHLLSRGLAEWGGSASPDDELARVMGFLSVEDLLAGHGRELRAAMESARPLTKSDWRRVLLATEIVFASAVVGAGWDWRYITGLSDEDTIRLLRAVQGKVSHGLRSG